MPGRAPATTDVEAARQLLLKALRVHAQRDELPVWRQSSNRRCCCWITPLTRLQRGFSQFKKLAGAKQRLLTLFVRDHPALRCAQVIQPDAGVERSPLGLGSPTENANGQSRAPTAGAATAAFGAERPMLNLSLRQQYNQIFTRLKMTSVDFATRRDVLRDIYRELSDRPGERTTDELLEQLCERYETQGLIRSKTTLRQIWQMGFRQRAFDYATRWHRCMSRFGWRRDRQRSCLCPARRIWLCLCRVNAGLEIDKAEMASILLNDGDHTEYIQSLLDDLEKRG
jgi:hypothetical protein